MDWTRFLKPKIYNRAYFLFYFASLFTLILLLLILINFFIKAENLKSIGDINIVLDTTRSILKKDIGIRSWAPDPILITLFALLVLWIFVFLETVFKYTWRFMMSPKKWELKKDFNFECFNDLEIQGNISDQNKGLKITSSAAGVLIKHNYWKDFNIEFVFNFEKLKLDKKPEIAWKKNISGYKDLLHKPKNNFFGLLFRAQDLNNYFMISIGVKQILKESAKNIKSASYEKKILITPHIKVNGDWDVFESIEFDPKSVNFESKDNFVTCIVSRNILTLKIKNETDFKWILPSKFRANWKGEPGIGQNIDGFGDQDSIPFKNSYGMLGFRAYGKEQVVIKDLIINKLD